MNGSPGWVAVRNRCCCCGIVNVPWHRNYEGSLPIGFAGDDETTIFENQAPSCWDQTKVMSWILESVPVSPDAYERLRSAVTKFAINGSKLVSSRPQVLSIRIFGINDRWNALQANMEGSKTSSTLAHWIHLISSLEMKNEVVLTMHLHRPAHVS